jgi:Leucine-rich repeat (LRR) protein
VILFNILGFCVLYCFFFLRLCFTLLDKVWSDGNSELTPHLSCSTDHNCTIENVHIIDFGEIEHRFIEDIKLAKTLTFQKSRFEQFPKGIAKHFVVMKELRVTDCNMTTLGNNFVSYGNLSKNNLLPILEDADFSRNQLSEVKLFTRLPNLKKINLSSNQIKGLESGSFSGLDQLEVLDLGSNSILEIAPFMFLTVPNMKNVILSNNKLKQLPESVFSSQKNLLEIDLAQNNLTTFDFGVIGASSKLTRINLAKNKMTSLQNLTRLSNGRTDNININVTDNKWNCFYAQLLEELAPKHKFELIGNIVNCLTDWLDSTEKKSEQQKNNIKNLVKRLNSTLDRCNNTMKQLVEQNNTIIQLQSNFINMTAKMEKK